jgi:hypothetical protein
MNRFQFKEQIKDLNGRGLLFLPFATARGIAIGRIVLHRGTGVDAHTGYMLTIKKTAFHFAFWAISVAIIFGPRDLCGRGHR